MKANELMIGDWVYVSKNFTQKYHKIRALSNDEGAVLKGIYVNEYGVESYSVFSQNDTEPIPLTLEILEKNGFSTDYCNDDLSYAQSCGDVIGIHINGKNGFMDEMYFKYVHQLQQALRLCGIEKEIVL